MRRRTSLGSEHLIRGSALSAVAVGLNGLGGFAFWAVLARWEEDHAVGQAQELFTAVLVVTYLTSLGLPIAVARFSCDRSPQAISFFRVGVVATAASSIVGVAGLAYLAPDGLLRPLDGMGGPAAFGVLAAMTVGMSCAVLVEVRLMALRRWGLVVARVAFVVVARFPLLVIVPDDAALWSFLLVAGLPAATGVVGALALWWRHRAPTIAIRADRRAWTRYSLVNYVGLLGAQGPQFLVPFAVALAVPSADFAPFYIGWGATAVVFLLPHMAGQTLLTESAKPGADRSGLARLSLVMSLIATSVIAVLSFGVGPVARALLGSTYAVLGDLLPWLLGASVPWAVTAIALADARVRSAGRAVVTLTAAFFATTLLGVQVGVTAAGIEGAAIGWFAANVLVAAGAVLVLLPSLERRHLRLGVRTHPPMAIEPVPRVRS